MLSALTIDSLAVHGPGVTAYLLQQHDGLEMPEIRTPKYDNPGENGGTVPNSLYGGRLITLGGKVRGSDPASYMAARRALAYACRIQRDSYGLVGATRITFTAIDGASYFVDANLMPPYKAMSIDTTSSPFQFNFYAPDTNIYGATAQSTGLITRQTSGGATFPLIFPITFTGGNAGTGILTNDGNADTWPIFYLRGTHTNPRIYSLEQAKGFQLDYTTTNATDVITVDMRRKIVMLNGTTSLLRYRNQTDRSWLSADVGPNTYLFTSGAPGDTGTFEGVAYPAFLGL